MRLLPASLLRCPQYYLESLQHVPWLCVVSPWAWRRSSRKPLAGKTTSLEWPGVPKLSHSRHSLLSLLSRLFLSLPFPLFLSLSLLLSLSLSLSLSFSFFSLALYPQSLYMLTHPLKHSSVLLVHRERERELVHLTSFPSRTGSSRKGRQSLLGTYPWRKSSAVLGFCFSRSLLHASAFARVLGALCELPFSGDLTFDCDCPRRNGQI